MILMTAWLCATGLESGADRGVVASMQRCGCTSEQNDCAPAEVLAQAAAGQIQLPGIKQLILI